MGFARSWPTADALCEAPFEWEMEGPALLDGSAHKDPPDAATAAA